MTVSLPVRRRGSSRRDRGRRLLDLERAAPRAAGASSSVPPRRLTLPAAVSAATLAAAALPARSATSRRDSSSPSGLAPRRPRRAGAIPRRSLARFLFLGLAPSLVLGAAARFLGGALRFLAARARPRRSAAWRRASSSALMRALQGARAAARSSAVSAVREHHRRGAPAAAAAGGGRCCRHVAAGAALPRACSSSGVPGRHALLAHLDLDGLGAAMREALADLAGLDRLAQLEPAAGAARLSGRFCLARCYRSSRSGTVICCPVRRNDSSLSRRAGAKAAEPRRIEQQTPRQRPGAERRVHDMLAPQGRAQFGAVSTRRPPASRAPAPASLPRPPRRRRPPLTSTAALPPRTSARTFSKPRPPGRRGAPARALDTTRAPAAPRPDLPAPHRR